MTLAIRNGRILVESHPCLCMHFGSTCVLHAHTEFPSSGSKLWHECTSVRSQLPFHSSPDLTDGPHSQLLPSQSVKAGDDDCGNLTMTRPQWLGGRMILSPTSGHFLWQSKPTCPTCSACGVKQQAIISMNTKA